MAETKTGMQQEENKDLGEMLGGLGWGDNKPTYEDKNEISIRFAKGMMKDFTAQDGKEYARISIPVENQPEGKSWPSFVIPKDMIRENEGGKSMWAKLPANGKTTLSMNENAFGLVADAMDDFMMRLANINDCLRRDIYEARKNGN